GRARSKALPAVIGAKIFPPQEVPKPGTPFHGTYEGAPLAPDPSVEAAIARPLADARSKRDEKVGVRIAREIAPAYDTESQRGNLFADLMRAANPHADVALTSGGSLRAVLPVGMLTYGQLHEALPFDDRLVPLSGTGDALAATVAHNLGRPGGILALSRVRARA